MNVAATSNELHTSLNLLQGLQNTIHKRFPKCWWMFHFIENTKSLEQLHNHISTNILSSSFPSFPS